MTETGRRRRRWPWVVLAVVLLLVGGPIAWRFRPLNATERKLVGIWASASSPVQKMRFTAARGFGNNLQNTASLDSGKECPSSHFTDFGTWTADSTEVTLDVQPIQPGPLDERVLIWFMRAFGFARAKIPITFEDADHLSFDDEPFVRVPE